MPYDIQRTTQAAAEGHTFSRQDGAKDSRTGRLVEPMKPYSGAFFEFVFVCAHVCAHVYMQMEARSQC